MADKERADEPARVKCGCHVLQPKTLPELRLVPTMKGTLSAIIRFACAIQSAVRNLHRYKALNGMALWSFSRLSSAPRFLRPCARRKRFSRRRR